MKNRKSVDRAARSMSDKAARDYLSQLGAKGSQGTRPGFRPGSPVRPPITRPAPAGKEASTSGPAARRQAAAATSGKPKAGGGTKKKRA